jgi:hypothetical protein
MFDTLILAVMNVKAQALDLLSRCVGPGPEASRKSTLKAGGEKSLAMVSCRLLVRKHVGSFDQSRMLIFASGILAIEIAL